MDGTISKPKHKHKPRGSLSKKPGCVRSEFNFTLKARIWLDAGGETYLAPGRVTLLERIEEYGSITRAAKSMEMSYRHAWLLVDDMNNKAPKPLLIRATGGKGGGGTHLTDEGKIAIEEFNNLQVKLKKFLKKLS